jgi:hypothetical protein
MLRVMMTFHKQTIGSGCNGGPAHSWNQMRMTGAVRGVDHNRQVSFAFQLGNNRQS